MFFRRSPWAWFAIPLVGVTLATAGYTAGTDDIPMAKAETVGMSSERLQRIPRFIQQHIDANQIAGAVTLVARKGKVVHFDAQGWRYKEEQRQMEKDAIFSLMSMTKPIVSAALMMLWEEGKFTLDDPISRWLPGYANKTVVDTGPGRPAAARPVSVRHVLTHTSGLSLTSTSYRAASSGPGSERPKTLLEAVERAAPIPVAFQPGEKWQYGLVDRLRRRARGEDLGHVARSVLAPADLRAARDARHALQHPEREGGPRSRHLPARRSRGRSTLSAKPEFREPTTYFPGVAGLSGTAADYFRFCQMLLNGGEYNGHRLLGRMTVNMMITNQIGTGQAGLYPRRRLWLRSRIRRPAGPVAVTGRAVDRQLHVGRRQRHRILGGPCRGL